MLLTPFVFIVIILTTEGALNQSFEDEPSILLIEGKLKFEDASLK